MRSGEDAAGDNGYDWDIAFMAKSIMANSMLNAAAGLSLLVTGFFCSIIAARLLGPEANGIIAFSLWLATTGALVAELGTGVTLLRILPQLKVQGFSAERRRGFAAYLLWPVLLSTVALLVVYALVFWESEQHHWATSAPSVVIITGVLLFIQSIGSYSKNYLIGEQELGPFFRLTMTASVLQLITVLAGAIVFGVAGALVGYAVGQAVPFFYSLGILGTRRDACDISARYLVGSSLILSLQFIVDSIFLNRIELFFLQQYHGVEVVGFYAVSLSLANLALQLPVQLTGSLLPYYAEQLEAQESSKLPVRVFEGVVRSLSYITLPMSFGLAAISWELVVAIYGRAFEPSGTIVAILALTAPPYVFGQVCTQYLFSLDRVRERLLIGIIGAIVMVGGAFLLVPALGGEGAAIVRFVVFLAMCILMVRKMEFDGSMRSMFVSLAKVTLASAICAIAAYGVTRVLPGVTGLVLAIMVGGAAYGVALRIFHVIPAEDAMVLRKMIAKLPRRFAGIASRILQIIAPGRLA